MRVSTRGWVCSDIRRVCPRSSPGRDRSISIEVAGENRPPLVLGVPAKGAIARRAAADDDEGDDDDDDGDARDDDDDDDDDDDGDADDVVVERATGGEVGTTRARDAMRWVVWIPWLG